MNLNKLIVKKQILIILKKILYAYFILEKLAKILHVKMEEDATEFIMLITSKNPNVIAKMVFMVKTVNMKIVNKWIL